MDHNEADSAITLADAPLAERKNILLSFREYRNKKLQEQTVEFISRYPWHYLVTLNFNYAVSEAKAQKCLLSFVKDLNNEVFGKRSSKAVNLIISLETHKAGGFHVHLLIQSPLDRINPTRKDEFDLQQAVIDCWQNADKATANVMRSCPDRKSWFEEIYNKKRAIEYITKEILVNGRKDVIQWDISNVQGRRYYSGTFS